MKNSARWTAASACLLSAVFAAGQQVATIRRVSVVGQGKTFSLEIESSSPIVPQTQVITGPDRLVIDFPNAVPSRSLRPLLVQTSQVKGVRTGLFEATPPIARVVIDLNGPQPYEILPSGNKVIVKLVSGAVPPAPAPAALIKGGIPHAQPAVVALTPPAKAQPAAPARPHAEIVFRDGKLSISSDRAKLADILHEVQRRTGANVMLPPGGGQEAVIAHLGPAPVREVLSALLDGSAYNVVILGGSGSDRSSVASVILTSKNGGEDMPANIPMPAEQPAADTAGEAAPPPPDNPPPVMDNSQDNPPPADNQQPGQESGPQDSIPVPPPPQ